MELTHLVHAGAVKRRAARLLCFFALGSAFAGAWATADATSRPVVTVRVPAGASAATTEARADEAVALWAAEAWGWIDGDPVVRDRLVRNLRFVDGVDDDAPADDDAAVSRARALGMHRHDPVVRARLFDRVRRRLERPAQVEEPDDDALRAFLERHAARYERPVAVRLEQRFFTHRADAAAALARLEDGEAVAGEPLLVDQGTSWRDAHRLDSAYGEGFGAAVAGAPVSRWAGPLRSSFGWHAVRVIERRDAEVPALDAIRDRLVHAWRTERAEAHRTAGFRAMREAVDVRVIREAAP